ncbi:MAG: J domain-containing protein [bacterium]|nr:J domain-containing protein [bacterium]
MAEDYYQLLGVARTATAEEIKKAYRQLVRKHHPDIDKTDGADSRFKKINQANEVLSDPQKRATYDRYGSGAFEGNAAGGAPGGGNPFSGFGNGGFQYSYSNGTNAGNAGFEGVDPFDILETFFGGGSPFGRRNAPRQPTYQIQITFDEAVHGVEKEVSIENNKRKIKIPSGVDDGTRIKFDDFSLIISVTPSTRFQRDGFDIILEEKVSLITAILGGNINVPTIDGDVQLKVQPGTQPDTVIRLKERGVKHPRNNSRGDQYVKFKVTIPTKVSGKAKKLLEELQSELK